MKKLNRTYIMGIVFIILALWVLFQTTQIPEKLVSNEPGPKLFPYISAIGMIVMAVLSMIMVECIVFCVAMNVIGFWITAMVGMMMFIMTLKVDKKINLVFAIVFSIALGSLCYFGFTKGFNIPLPKGLIWSSLGIKMP